MATVVVGCDSNGVHDAQVQNTVVKALEKQGHNVEKLSIAAGPFSAYDYGHNGKNPKGKIGVYIIADGIFSIADHYNGGGFKYCYFIIRGDLGRPRMKSRKDFETRPIGADPDCNGVCDKLRGKTFPQINEIVKSRCKVVFGVNAQEMASELIKAMGGETSSSDSSNSDSNSGGGTAKESIQKLLKHWDGEVECRIIGNTVYINKVREPQSHYSLLLEEGVNVFSDSIKITDVNPNTVNYLVVNWSGGKITIKDKELIKRFGTIKSEVNAVKKITKTVTTSKTTTDTSTDDTSTEDIATDTGTEDTGSETDTTGTEDIGDVTDTGDTGSEESNSKTTVVEVPITKYKDALAFANTEWHKIKRDNGHTIECQVAGSPKWRTGEWSKVVFPSFGENGFMYITRASHSDDGGDWTCNLTLTDYPPGWGVEETNNNSDSNSSTTSGDAESVVNQVCKEIGKFSYSHSCSDGGCIKSTKKGDCHALSDYIYTKLKKAGVPVRIYTYVTGSSDDHRQVKYNNGSEWVMFPYGKSGIDHFFYTNSIPSSAEIYKK